MLQLSRFYLCTVKKLNWRTLVFGVGIAVIVPTICFFILRSTGHTGHIKRPPNYAVDSVIQKTVDGELVNDTIWHTVKNQAFISHLNDTVRIGNDFPGKMLLVNFFKTTDTANSALLTYHMKMLQKGFKKRDTSMQLVSISIDPFNDQVEMLRDYANTHSTDHDTWTFITTSQNELYTFAKDELRLEVSKNEEKVILEQPNEIVLLDKYRNIRGYYDGLDSMDVKRCIDEMAVIMVEKNRIHEKSRR